MAQDREESVKAPERMAGVRPLGESGLTLADPAEDIRGRKLRDSAGDEIGDIDEVLLDDRERRVRLLRVDLLGLGKRKILVPVEAIIGISDSEVHINRTRGHAAGTPRYSLGSVDQRYLESVYAHYGYYPYWAPGHVYPSYPAYP